MLSRFSYPLLSAHQPAVRWNFTANVMDGALYSFAMSFVSLTTIAPVLVKKLGGSGMAVGMIPVLWTLGLNLPQILIAGYTERYPNKKGLLLRTALVQRVAWLITGILILLSVHLAPNLALGLYFVGLTLVAIGTSVNMPAWFDLVARITPISLRGRLFAVRMVIGSILGVLGGYFVVVILDAYSFPTNFAVLYFVAFSITMVSYIFLVVLRDHHTAPPPDEVNHDSIWRQIPNILRTQHNFRAFLIADSLIVVALVADAFYAVNAFERFDLSAGYAGLFTIAMTATSVVASLAFGYVADRIGHRLNLLVAALALAATCGLALMAPSVWVYFVVFVGAAVVLSLRHISRLSIIAELCSEADRPTYIALSNMITAPLVLFAILAGWGADRIGYDVVFIGAGCLALASAALLYFRFVEPRLATG